MNKIKIGLLAVALLFSEISTSNAYVASKLDDMDFGTFVRVKKLKSSSFVTIDTAGNITCSDDLRPISGNKGTPGAVHYSQLSAFLRFLDFSVTSGSSESPAITITDFTTNPASLSVIFGNKDQVDVYHGATIKFASPDQIRSVNGTFVSHSEGWSGSADTTIPFYINIQEPDINITENAPLNFGTLIATNLTENVIISPDGNVSGSSHIIVGSKAGSQVPGKYSITSKENLSVTVKLPSTILLSNHNGGSMTVKNVTGSINGAGNSGVLDAGKATLYVGGNLEVSPQQSVGKYNGTFTITLDY